MLAGNITKKKAKKKKKKKKKADSPEDSLVVGENLDMIYQCINVPERQQDIFSLRMTI